MNKFFFRLLRIKNAGRGRVQFNAKLYSVIARSIFGDAAIHFLHVVANFSGVMDRFVALAMTKLTVSEV